LRWVEVEVEEVEEVEVKVVEVSEHPTFNLKLYKVHIGSTNSSLGTSSGPMCGWKIDHKKAEISPTTYYDNIFWLYVCNL